MDMEDERPESIGYQVVNAKACRSEDMGKPQCHQLKANGCFVIR